ncbi:MAG: selenide, water dikinase SelD [Thermomicrobiales bacterium]
MIIEETIRMTSLATCAGCAAKISPEALASMLPAFTDHTDLRLLIGLQTSDDAAVFRVTPDLAIVQTTDFFTPIVDDPWTFGAIAAANAISDIYAMGGEVRFALNIAAFPESLAPDIISAILEGGAAKVREAGGVIAGGHTITTVEPIYGLSVTGDVHPERLWTKSGARPGDVLFLTKRIGAGVITTTLKNQQAPPAFGDAAIESMLTLNRTAAAFARRFPVHACTDITGYSLSGHCHEVASRSGVKISLSASSLPLLEGARRAVELEQIPGGLLRNRHYFTGHGVRVADEVDPVVATLCFDPQTSGGLLFAVPRTHADAFERDAGEDGLPLWRIGYVSEGDGVDVVA